MISAEKVHSLIAKVNPNLYKHQLTDTEIKILLACDNGLNHCILTKENMLAIAYKILLNKGYKVEWFNNADEHKIYW